MIIENRDLTHQENLHFRDELRQARAIALGDAEAFDKIIYAIERMGGYLCPESCPGRTNRKSKDKAINLAHKGTHLTKQAGTSPLTVEIPSIRPDMHTSFEKLFRLVREARNDVMHEGAFARHLTTHAVELSIILEDSLMSGLDKVGDFMVRSPVSASLWQPLSFIRQSMLINSFSYLPLCVPEKTGESTWQLIADLDLAKYLRAAVDNIDRTKRLAQPLREIIKLKEIELHNTKNLKPDVPIVEAMENWSGLPICVQSNHSNDLIGILTPFDLL